MNWQTWAELGLAADAKVTVRDLWVGKSLGSHTGSFQAMVGYHEAKIYTFVAESKAAAGAGAGARARPRTAVQVEKDDSSAHG